MNSPPHTVLSGDSIQSLLRLVGLAARQPGCFAEIGVYKGGSAWHLAAAARTYERELHLFDTFAGIPEKGPKDIEHNIGDFGDASVEAVRAAIPDAIFHVGVFPYTIPADMPPIAFMHVDCDQYRATHAAIERLWPLVVPGGIMLFDDYGCTSGCTLAVGEAFTRRKIQRTAQGKAYVAKGYANG